MSALEQSKDWADTVPPTSLPPLTQPNSAEFRISVEIQKKRRKRNKSASPPLPLLELSDAMLSLCDRTEKPKGKIHF